MKANNIARRACAMGSLVAGLVWSVNGVAETPVRPFELGVEVGSAKHEYTLESIGDKSADEIAFRAYGSWFPQTQWAQVKPGVRAGYAYFGAAEMYRLDAGVGAYTVESEVSAFTLGGVLAVPIGNGPVEVWGEAGVAFWDLDLDQKASLTGSGISIQREMDTDSGTAPYIGIGAGVQLGKGFGLSLSALWYDMEPEYQGEDVDLKIRVVSAGASFRF